MKINLKVLGFLIGVLSVLCINNSFAQNVGISSSSSFTPDASAGLDISYTNKGLLIPRVALTATNAAGPISSPATSLLVYNTAIAGTSPNNVIPGYYYWNGSAWVMLSTGSQASNFWSITGNSGTSYPTNYLGTSDNFGLHFKTNAIHRLWIDSLGSVAVGLSPIFSSSRERFLVDAGSTSANPTPTGAFNVISGKGYLDNYLQLNIQNNSATAAASSDIVASNDQATETTNYIDMGINSSAYAAGGLLGGPSTAYLLATGNDFAIGNSTLNKNLLFFTAGTTSPATNTERMRIDPSGNVGIGTTGPTQKLDITGNLKFSGALMPNNNPGTAGYFLVSTGASSPPTWFSANGLAWTTTGNSGTTPGTNFIGNTDAVDFVIKTNNAERARFSSAGNFGIGTTNPGQKLDVNGNINAAGSIYVDGASSNTGTLNPGLYFGGANSGEVISSKRTSGTNQYGIDFYTASNNRMTIANTGNVGIGITTPATKLHVFGANPLTLSGVVTGTNTTADSLLTITSGLVRKLPLSGFATSSNSWSTAGNAGTSYPSSFVGTTDANGLHFRANSIHGLMLDSLGNVAVGLGPTFSSGVAREKFLVDAGSASYPTPTGAYNVISGKGYLDNYLQLNIQNLSPTASASTDIVASNDQASETANFIDMGINSSANTSSGILGGANTAYLLATGNEFFIGNQTPNKDLVFFTNTGTNNTESFRLDGATGNVGIGTNNPTAKLHLNGTNPLKINTVALGTNNSTDSLLTITTGLVRKLPTTTYVNTTATQSIAGAKTFSSAATFSSTAAFSSTTTFAGTATFSNAVAYPILVASAAFTLGTAHYTVIVPSNATFTVTLPTASSSTKRVYIIVNQTSSAITIGNYINLSGSTVSTVSSTNSVTVQSDGTNWYRIQ